MSSAPRARQDRPVTRLSSFRPCLCPCTPSTRPPCAPRAWGRERRPIPGIRGTHSLRGHAGSSTRYAPVFPFVEWSAAVLVPLRLDQERVPARPSHGIPLTGQCISLERAFSADRNAARLVQPGRLELPLLDPHVARELGACSREASCARRIDQQVPDENTPRHASTVWLGVRVRRRLVMVARGEPGIPEEAM
jgi:hypothetical protein